MQQCSQSQRFHWAISEKWRRPSDIYLVVNLRLSHASPPLQPLQQGQQVDIVVVKARIHHLSALFHSDAKGLDPTLEAAIFAEIGVDTAVHRRLNRGAAGASVELLFSCLEIKKAINI